MIKCKGSSTKISGSILDNVNDLANIISAVRQALSTYMPQECADRCIMTTIKIAYSDGDSEKTKQLAIELFDRLREGYEKKGDVERDISGELS